jgi:hypothetical protein
MARPPPHPALYTVFFRILAIALFRDSESSPSQSALPQSIICVPSLLRPEATEAQSNDSWYSSFSRDNRSSYSSTGSRDYTAMASSQAQAKPSKYSSHDVEAQLPTLSIDTAQGPETTARDFAPPSANKKPPGLLSRMILELKTTAEENKMLKVAFPCVLAFTTIIIVVMLASGYTSRGPVQWQDDKSKSVVSALPLSSPSTVCTDDVTPSMKTLPPITTIPPTIQPTTTLPSTSSVASTTSAAVESTTTQPTTTPATTEPTQPPAALADSATTAPILRLPILRLTLPSDPGPPVATGDPWFVPPHLPDRIPPPRAPGHPGGAPALPRMPR